VINKISDLPFQINNSSLLFPFIDWHVSWFHVERNWEYCVLWIWWLL